MVAPFSSRPLLNLGRFAVLSGLIFGEAVFFPASARAQPSQMCGDGTTFTVDLPPVVAGALESIELPAGCQIYALLVSGYEGNKELDQFLFYKLAKFVAENNGYVHYAWWNNLLAPYMTRPLHNAGSHPGNKPALIAFVPDLFIDKAIPNEDIQFQRDAERFLQAIRQNNPDALIVVAGHSMGGGSIARLAATRRVAIDIDLLAPIDPGGNRSRPEVLIPFNKEYNWTRWRATHVFRGWRVKRCIDRGPLGGCRQCTDVWSDFFITLPTDAPFECPQLFPIIDTGTQIAFGENIRRLYHRWQIEEKPQNDFDKDPQDRLFGHPGPRSTTDILGPNFQAGFGQSTSDDLPPDPDKTCSIHTKHDVSDPRDSSLVCASGDGHGEIVGIRVVCPREGVLSCSTSLTPLLQFANHKEPLGIQARFPPKTPSVSTLDCNETPSTWKDSVDKKAAFIELANVGPWPYEPCNPNLDMVSDDLIQIVQDILAQSTPDLDVIPPTSTGVLSPDANADGWHHDSVVVTIHAADNAGGSDVKEIVISLTGAESGDGVQSGSMAEFMVSNEGTTDISFFARDNQGNEEAPSNLLTVLIDRTPPTVTATVDPEPNERGWIHGDATVTFVAEDALSGVATVSEPVTVTTEGANQEVTGYASDRASNEAVTTAIVNVVKTLPQIPTNVVGRSRLLHVNIGWEGSENTLNFLVFRRLDSENDFIEIGQSIFPAFVDDLPTGTLSADYFVVAENDLGASASSEVVTVVPSLRQRR